MDLFEKIQSNVPVIMGIVNTTPDSFSDGGDCAAPDQAIAHGLRLLEEGADILDIGGESTRPGAQPVSVEEEIRRVLPVIEGLADKAPLLSVDTRNAETMRRCLAAGAHIINDISALRHDPESVAAVREAYAPVCLMHMQGTPQTMQTAPHYDDVVSGILRFFEERIAFCEKNGISRQRIILDPGIGFGKTTEHNLSILKNIEIFEESTGCPVMVGVSRKRFIGEISAEDDPGRRVPGSLAAALWAMERGVRIFRVHDVRETQQALDVYQAMLSAR